MELFFKDYLNEMFGTPVDVQWTPHHQGKIYRFGKLWRPNPQQTDSYSWNTPKKSYYVKAIESPGSYVQFEFGHIKTGLADRQNENPAETTYVMKRAMGAILSYVQQNKPKTVDLTPVGKSHGVRNFNARENIYWLWGKRNLAPAYTPITKIVWQRNDPS